MKAEAAHIIFEASRGREQIAIRKPSTVTIDKSWKFLTDKATIVLPRNVKDFDKQKVNEVFAVGDPVTINLGYDGEYYQEFTGFIARVSADVPIKIYCEDAMWKLKQIPVHISLAKATLQELLDQIISDYSIDALEVDLGVVRFSNYTVASVLDDLKSKYGLFSYIQNNTLICGKIYADDSTIDPVALHLEKNIWANTLEYRNKDDIKVKVTATSVQPDGKKISAEVGEDGGDQIRLPYFNITSEEELKKLAALDYRKYKVDGFKGTVTTYGEPAVEHGFKVDLKSEQYPDRDGIYYVESVRVAFGTGFKYSRIVTLGDKAS